MDVWSQYQATKDKEKRRAQEREPIPLWWLGQRDPIVRLTKWLVIWTALLFVGTIVSAGILFITDRTLRDTLKKSQRPWVVAESVERVPPGYFTPAYEAVCHIGYRVNYKNTGNSIATEFVFGSRIVRFPPTWEWLRDRIDILKKETIDVWSAKRPAGLPIGITLAPGQPTSFVTCPWTGDGTDPTVDQIKIGAFLVIGYVQYKDQFDIQHHTRFAFTTDSDSVHMWDGKSFAIYNDYQEAD